ncbi:MAG: hypothetical protein ACC644_06085 [Candidatus Hydrothermarchaeales archaeon]
MAFAVIDSSSLIFAFRVEELLVLLKERYSKIVLPKAVFDEVIDAGKKLGKREVLKIEDEIFSGFLEVKNVKNPMHIEHLGEGELEVLSYAKTERLPCIMDDKKARQLCVSLKLKAIPISSFIIWGARNGHLSERQAQEILNDLVKKGYRLRSDVYIQIIDAIKSGT